MKHPSFARYGLLLVCALLGSCASGARVSNAMLEQPPGSILILPPLDSTVETSATYGSLAALTVPLAEAGYYVFPVAVVDQLMRQNGLPDAFDMHQVSLDKLREIFDPDAVLYLTVTDWGTSYQILSSITRVSFSGRLVDARTGTELWSGSHSVARSSGNLGGGLIGSLAGALVNQVSTSISNPSNALANSTARVLLGQNLGRLPGPYHPEHGEVLGRLREARADRR